MQQLEHAARALGWQGCLIPDVEVFGVRFGAVARLRPDVHRWRIAHGWEPQLDPSWLRSWSEASGHDHLPVPGVDLFGILVPVSKARRALRTCGSLMTLAPCTAVLPGDHPYRPWPLTELDYYGIGVVRSGPEGPAELVLPPEDRSVEFGSSLLGRWLLEVLYHRILERDHRSPESATGSRLRPERGFPLE
ncbi:hypothetical protein DFQ14_10891 [Halopolyspora algeriensis]|uniref:Uncharacterized protein n=1 Tax=Halopolyspora algeriensis TaxID=1500506 RepID=A0A368VPC9_9ACTN|nr:hypothetical protein [Halopolyspora algeriensis]RCW42835.1 hypothetical protein DFQ14_10891 [Halopolyspora algeriensis]TQM56695.1 hypothetical protein FHU43_1509 [Halopolyspora algeriensis]